MLTSLAKKQKHTTAITPHCAVPRDFDPLEQLISHSSSKHQATWHLHMPQSDLSLFFFFFFPFSFLFCPFYCSFMYIGTDQVLLLGQWINIPPTSRSRLLPYIGTLYSKKCESSKQIANYHRHNSKPRFSRG